MTLLIQPFRSSKQVGKKRGGKEKVIKELSKLSELIKKY